MDTLGPAGLVLLALAVVAGAGTQRLTGLGLALVSSPFLVLLVGPFMGVLLANALSLVANLLVLAQTWRTADVRKALLLAVPGLLAVLPGAWVVRNLPAPVLSIAVGGLVLVALVVVLVSERARILRGTGGAVVAGATSGFMAVTAGVGGPAISVYAVSTGWAQASFVPTAQLYFATVNAASLAAKGWPDLSRSTWAVAAAALVVGIVVGQRLSQVVTPDQARRLVVVLAVLGSAATVVKGVVDLR